ncbi:linear amide C-N hydrolase [Carnobacterium divergens]|uniref:linear amide C-N hydrolase n=1 Tax=Carnobacterium divergens TaxID=2748 RepID=UPI002892CA75|nr:linear amide C-N hydrolase [Carnobacterium divergens]
MCTGISFKSVEGKSFLGRTQEYNIPYNYIGIQFPENFEASGIVEPWNTVYSVLGVGIQNQNVVAHGVVDGVNEQGLGGITQYFSEFNNYSSVEKITEAGKLPILAEQFIFWVLANCKDTGEVEEKILEVAIADISLSGQTPGLPQHFMFTDTTGRRIVVEPTKELGFKVYENTIGVMTNSPKFDWHVTNLENYTGLSDTNVKDAVFNDYKVLSAGKGSGLHGVPGDSTSVSRFVRASYLLK